MTRPDLTVGMPVYNAERLIGASLECILGQTLRDFRVLVFDNASTDRTPDIVQAHAARDSRVVLHRKERNDGAEQNFLDALAAAETEYFLWRADDDLSDADFLQRLRVRLQSSPNAALAVGRVESRRPAKNRIRQFPYVKPWRAPRIVNISCRMFLSHPSWIYGLWRTERLRRYYTACWEAFPTGWGNDHLVLLNVILDEAVVGDDSVRFIQQIDVRRGDAPRPPRPPYGDRISLKTDLLARYRPICRTAVAARRWSPAERRILDFLIDRYAEKRINTTEFQLLRLRMRKALFEALGRRNP